MAAKKSTKNDAQNMDEPHVVENDIEDDVVEKSPAEREVTPTGPMTFMVEIDGEEIELEDHYREDKVPAEFLLVNNEIHGPKYLPVLLEKLIGEEQMFELLAKDMSLDELQEVPRSWAKGRGINREK